MQDNRRQDNRITAKFPVDLQVDSQITIRGELKDISEKSAFIVIKESVFIQLNDEFGFRIKKDANDPEASVTGKARVSRIEKGEGIAIYFTQLIGDSPMRLKQLLDA